MRFPTPAIDFVLYAVFLDTDNEIVLTEMTSKKGTQGHWRWHNSVSHISLFIGPSKTRVSLVNSHDFTC